MKITETKFYDCNPKFGTSTRVLRNTISQLSRNNKYSLNEPNQRIIRNSIAELSQIPQKKVVKFLLDTASHLKYATNIKLEDSPLNDWKNMLVNAALAALSLIPLIDKTEFMQKIEKLRSTENLNGIERDILKLRVKLLKSVDIKQIENETNGGTQDFKHNLDYFIISSETTLEHKKYVLERLNYLMSDEYNINPQLKDKKSIVAAELVNDMAIFTPGHEIPNIKAVNQQYHGICGEISIVRKKIAYEDKPDYIDTILSELDDTNYIMVYDRSKLGSGEKADITKVFVDFDDALAKGFRIIDASSTQWMDISTKSGYNRMSYESYTPFDKEHFDNYADTFFDAQFEDPELKDIQAYYQALVKADSLINSYKASVIKANIMANEQKNDFKKNSKAIQDTISKLTDTIRLLYPGNNSDNNREIINGLLNLEKKYSSKLTDNKNEYIINEEEKVKKDKIRTYLLEQSAGKIDSIKDSDIDKIYEYVDLYHILDDTIAGNRKNKYGTARTRALYEVGAGVRYQFQMGLRNEKTLDYMMKKERISNREECLENTANTLLEKLKKGSHDTNIILNSLSKNTSNSINTREEGIEVLELAKEEIDENIKQINSIYKSIGLGNRVDGLIEYIESMLLEISDNNHSANIAKLARNIGIPAEQSKVINKLESLKADLLKNSKNYNKVFNVLGSSSQVSFLNDAVQNFFQKLSGLSSNDAIETLIVSNNLDTNNLQNEIPRIVKEILEKIKQIYEKNENLTQILRVLNNDGYVVYTPDPAEIIMKRFENNGTIPSEQDLHEIQTYLNNLQRVRTADEFNSKNKIKNKSLYKLSDRNKEILDKIDKNINPLSRYIKKQLLQVQQHIRLPLEELKRIIGVDRGDWWTRKEGFSGLYDGNSVRILEYITGRPHYTTNNMGIAIEKIKTTPYSGISTSSVFHDKVGMHAQYIADIEPVKMPAKENQILNVQTEDVLFQDNSWGPSEKENTWVDLSGFTRTDYRDNRGGKLGYITNNKFRNGNLVSRITNEMIVEEEPENVNSRMYKKLNRKKDNFSYKAPQYVNVAIDGKSPDAASTATSIYSTIFMPTKRLIGTIKKLTSNMSYEEITNRLHRIKNFKNNWERIYDKNINLIRGDKGSSIKTKEDYDKLPDNDNLKILLEKSALLNNLYIPDIPPVINNVSELGKYRNMQKQRAIKNFGYSFGKNINLMKFIANNLTGSYIQMIDSILKKHSVTMSDDEFAKTFCSFDVSNEDFNGSMKATIKLILEDIMGKFGKITDNPYILQNVADTLKQYFKDMLYFDDKDIKNPNLSHIIRFIDRIYCPSDDKELVKIYRNLQNMTKEEFKKEVIPLLKDEDLNIKNETGFSLLKKIQRYESDAEYSLLNTVFIDEIERNTEKSKYYTEYTYSKLSRTPKIMSKYTFDSAYREMKTDLSLLTYKKFFDKHKGRNLNKFGAFPAYPKVDYLPEKIFNSIVSAYIDEIENEIEKIKNINDILEYYEVSDALKEFSKNIKSSDTLNEEQYKALNNALGRIATLSYNDESQAYVNVAALEAMEIEPGEKFKKYSKYIKTITVNIDKLKENAPVEDLNNEVKSEKMLITKQEDMLIKTYIRTRYQKNFAETLKAYKQSLIKNRQDTDGTPLSELCREEVIDELKAYFILQEPEEVLDRYIQSLSKDSPLHDYNPLIESMLKRALDCAKLCDIQRIIMGAVNDGIETDIKSAFKSIQVETVNGTSLMSDDNIISYIVNSLVYDDQNETALLFLNKLGLNETFVKYALSNFNYEETKKFIEESTTKYQYYKEYAETFNKYFGIARDKIENGQNALRAVNELKKTLMKAGKIYSIDKKHSRIFLNAVDTCKAIWKEHPDFKPIDVFNEAFYTAGSAFERTANALFDETNKVLDTQQLIMNLINNVGINKNSDINKLRKEINNKFDELVQYNNRMITDLQERE